MKQARTLTDKQLKAVLAHCATRRHAARDRAIVMVSFLAGLRAKEIAALTVDNVRNADGTIKDDFVLTAEQTKGKRARRVFINSRLKKELAGYLAQTKLSPRTPMLFRKRCFQATSCRVSWAVYAQGMSSSI